MTEKSKSLFDREVIMEKIAAGMKKGIDLATGKDVASIQAFVDQQKKLHPEIADNPSALADRMLGKRPPVLG